ncbi:HNH endonuclease [Pontibacter sp. FD36]|uniref:HNH endonuclease n=1 Tax=Pontibacter sp. FD36 TaxID=2789860 RepID=UPI0018A8AD6F|nr:HNH endonuclease [Pontibacter sp. FD36]MBF8964299.1 HNH endonuclease [Pontibacter sp. FD36]
MEIWKNVQGYDSYQVSNYGKVRSTKYKQPRILKPGDIGTGHQQVTLRTQGKNKKLLVHRLVANAFISNPGGYPFVDHINGIPEDNRVENLRWVTNRENLQNRNDNREGRTTSRYVGVSYRKSDSCWIARIYINKENHLLGSFKDEEEAALAYDTVLIDLGLSPVNSIRYS